MLTIYFTCVITGLLYPVIDWLLIKYSKIYIAADYMSGAPVSQDYRESAPRLKLILAFMPVINAAFIFVLIFIAVFFVREWWFGRKKAFIWWLAGTSLKHHFVFKTNLVKKLFPSYLDYYYFALEKRHWNYKLATELSKILVKIAQAAFNQEKGEEKGTEQVLNDALEIAEQLKKEDNGK